MEYTEIAKAVTELGFGAVSLAAVLVACWKLLSWGKSIVDNAMSQLERERERSAEVYEKLSKAIDDHSSQSREFHMEVRSAHGYQREEHNKMIEGVTAICGEIKRCSEKSEYDSAQRQKEHEKMIENLDEQSKVLLRINGEKHS